jgi:Tfp pilus assembly protein PilF
MANPREQNRLHSLLSLLEKDPNDSFIKYGIALEYLSIKDYSKAEEYLKLLLQNDPDYVPAYMQYAQMKANQNKIDEAKDLFKKGIAAAQKTGDKHAAKEMEEFLDELE